MWEKILYVLIVTRFSIATTIISDALGFTGSYEIDESEFDIASCTPAYEVNVSSGNADVNWLTILTRGVSWDATDFDYAKKGYYTVSVYSGSDCDETESF